MECPKCGTKVNEEAKFCQECGANLQKEIINKEATENKLRPKLDKKIINDLQSRLENFKEKSEQIDYDLSEVYSKITNLGFENFFKRIALTPKYYSELNNAKDSFAKMVLNSGQSACLDAIHLIKKYSNTDELEKSLSNIKREALELQQVTYRSSLSETEYSDAFEQGFYKITNCISDISTLTNELIKELKTFK